MTSDQNKLVLGTTPAKYSMGLVAPPGRLVFISGQTALDTDGNIVGAGDCDLQCRHALANIRTLLEEAGGSMNNVVKISTFITNIDNFDAFNTVRNEFFSDPYPTSTIVEISALGEPELLIEIEAVAVI